MRSEPLVLYQCDIHHIARGIVQPRPFESIRLNSGVRTSGGLRRLQSNRCGTQSACWVVTVEE